MEKKIVGIGVILMIVGLYFSGALESILSGDSTAQIKLLGSAIAVALGSLLIKKGII